MAVTENLQRKDVTPIEEANAYQKLMESGRYDVQSLAVQFGKARLVKVLAWVIVARLNIHQCN